MTVRSIHADMTWGIFTAGTEADGVTIEELPPTEEHAGGKYLRRFVDGQVLSYPLPTRYSPQLLMGAATFYSVCRRLRIPESRFKGWAYIL